jgi:hypothetical protein
VGRDNKRKASDQKQEGINLGQKTQKQHKTASLRYFPVRAGHFRTGDLLNESAIKFAPG